MNIEPDYFIYDVALSFAGEDRIYVEEVANLLRSFGVKVFYDKFEEANLWGKNLYEHLNDVYKSKAKYTLMFISKYYKEKLWTNHERKSMQERAFNEAKEYILPARFDDTEIPGLHSTLGYVDLRDKSPADLVAIICSKIGWVTKKRWWGEWNVDTPVVSYLGTLKILEVDDNYFEFSLLVVNGTHLGEISGKAYLKSNCEAISHIKCDDDREDCVLRFFRANDVIQVSENSSCLFYHGMRAYFNGDYKIKKDIFYRLEYVNDIVLTRICRLLKDDLWDKYLKCFGHVQYEDILLENKLKVITGGVAGAFMSYQGILLIDSSYNVWGAFLDEDKVYYFTSISGVDKKMPPTIEEWRSDFKELELVYVTGE
jgi:hypothetical protein